MTKAPEILVLGHHGCGARKVRVHHVPVAGETVVALDYQFIKDGGKGSHQAMVIGRLGGDVGFIGKIATDAQADEARQWLVDDHVDITHLLRMEYQLAGAGMIMVDDEGNNAIVSVEGVRSTLTFDEVRPCIEDFRDSKYFITGFEIPLLTAIEGAKLAKQFGMTTILNPAPAPNTPVGRLDFIDILIPNETEAKIMAGFGVSDKVAPESLLYLLRDKYQVDTVIITLGDQGALGYSQDEVYRINPVKVKPVDTIGAGDTFIGALTFALSQGRSLPDAMEWANIAAAISVTRSGSIPSFPKKNEVDELMVINSC